MDLGDLVDNVALKLGDPSLQFFTAPEIKQAIGESYRFYYMRLIKKAEGYFETTVNLDIVASTETVSLAALTPPYKNISQLWRYVTNGQIPMKEQENRFDAVYTLAVASGDAYVPQYKQQGTNIILYPPPGASQTAALKLDYVYLPTFPSSTSADAFDFNTGTSGITAVGFPTVYEINIIVRSAIKCMETKDVTGGLSDTATFRQELVELDKSFDDSSENDEYPDSVTYRGINYRNGGYY